VDPLENVARLLDRGTMQLERRFAVPPERLWEAVATREGLSHWFMPTPFEIEEGGRFSFEKGWDGTVTRVDPPRCIEFQPDGSQVAFLRFEIEPTEEGCLLRLIDRMDPQLVSADHFPEGTPKHVLYQPGGKGTHWSGIVSGYHGFVDALECHLTGRRVGIDHAERDRRYPAVLDAWHA